MWQVSGRSDITDFEEVVRLDKEYIENWNIGLDMIMLAVALLIVNLFSGSVTQVTGLNLLTLNLLMIHSYCSALLQFYNVNDIIREMTDDTQLLILLNPNNPMGNVYSDDEFESIMKVARQKQITVLVDEAYHYFYPKTFIKYALTEDHVFITRTFSKLFSMAGCRLGYVVGWSDGVKMVQKMCTPHNTNAFAMMFAEKVLTTPGMARILILSE